MNLFFSVSRPSRHSNELFYDYRTNVKRYPEWQGWMREKRPHLLVVWVAMTSRSTYLSQKRIAGLSRMRDVHILAPAHSALDTAADEIAELVRGLVG